MLSYENYNWNGDKLMRVEGETELLRLWNMCMKVSVVTDNDKEREAARQEAADIMRVGPEMGFYVIPEETYEGYKNTLTKHKL
jgi:hypothetical protein